MADKYINPTGLSVIKTWVENKFALGSDLSALATVVNGLIGAEPNVIEVVQKNGTALPVVNKAVNVTVPTAVSDLSDANDYATKTYVDTYGGKIDVIQVNGTTQTITNKTVNITVPTAVSDLANDSGFQTASDVETAINTKIASAYIYKGSVATYNDLPVTGNKVGDVYDVQSTGINYAWDGTGWDALGAYVDTSLYWAKADLVAMTTSEINAILTPSS